MTTSPPVRAASWRTGACGYKESSGRIERENVEKAAAIEIRQPGEQSPRRGVLALARLQPLDGQQWFHGAADDLAADGAVIILNLFDGIAIAVFALDSPLQTSVAATAVAGQDFDAIKGGGDVALAASPGRKLCCV